MANPWFRMYSEFSHDPKVQMLSESMQRRYIMIMCLRCSNELVTLHETEIAFHMRITEQELSETKALFISKGFVDSAWNLLNWEKRQFSSDTSKVRVAKHRALQKEKQDKSSNGDVTLQKQDGNVLEQNRTEQNRTDVSKDTSSPKDSATIPNCPHSELIDLYAKHLPELPGVKSELWGGARAAAMRQRWVWLLTAKKKSGDRYAETKAEAIDWFDRFFGHVAKSDFLTGRNGKWSSCDLGWLMKEENFAKVIQGNYENKGHS